MTSYMSFFKIYGLLWAYGEISVHVKCLMVRRVVSTVCMTWPVCMLHWLHALRIDGHVISAVVMQLCPGLAICTLWFICTHSKTLYASPQCVCTLNIHTPFHRYTHNTHKQWLFYLIKRVVSAVAPVTVLAIWDIRRNFTRHVHAALCGVTHQEAPSETVA